MAALAASIVSACAALAGVAISNRHNLSQHREILREEALTAQRNLVAETLVAGRRWADLQLVMVPMMSKFSHEDLMEFADSATSAQLGELRRELEVALTRANLFLADLDLRRASAVLAAFVETFAEAINAPILKNPGHLEEVLSGIQEVFRFRSSLTEFQHLAVERLPSPAWHRSDREPA